MRAVARAKAVKRTAAPSRTLGGPGREVGITLGRAAAAKIQAVEGIVLTAEAQAMFCSFDEQGLSAAERRLRIFERYARRSG